MKVIVVLFSLVFFQSLSHAIFLAPAPESVSVFKTTDEIEHTFENASSMINSLKEYIQKTPAHSEIFGDSELNGNILSLVHLLGKLIRSSSGSSELEKRVDSLILRAMLEVQAREIYVRIFETFKSLPLSRHELFLPYLKEIYWKRADEKSRSVDYLKMFLPSLKEGSDSAYYFYKGVIEKTPKSYSWNYAFCNLFEYAFTSWKKLKQDSTSESKDGVYPIRDFYNREKEDQMYRFHRDLERMRKILTTSELSNGLVHALFELSEKIDFHAPSLTWLVDLFVELEKELKTREDRFGYFKEGVEGGLSQFKLKKITSIKVEKEFVELKEHLKEPDSFVFDLFPFFWKDDDVKKDQKILDSFTSINQTAGSEGVVSNQIDHQLEEALENRRGSMTPIYQFILSLEPLRQRTFFPKVLKRWSRERTVEEGVLILKILSPALRDRDSEIFDFFNQAVLTNVTNDPSVEVLSEDRAYAIRVVLNASLKKLDILRKSGHPHLNRGVYRQVENSFSTNEIQDLEESIQKIRKFIRGRTSIYVLNELAELGMEVDIKNSELSWVFDLLTKIKPVLAKEEHWKETYQRVQKVLIHYDCEGVLKK